MNHLRSANVTQHVRLVCPPIVVTAPLKRDVEVRRWYSEGADQCLVLTKHGRVLTPSPIFGPTSYALVAYGVSRGEAAAFARARALIHERDVAPDGFRRRPRHQT